MSSSDLRVSPLTLAHLPTGWVFEVDKKQTTLMTLKGVNHETLNHGNVRAWFYACSVLLQQS
jgi:hypothetical protein